MFKSLLNKGKDLTLSLAIKKVINKKIEKFGEISKLDFNTNTKTIDIEVELKGENKILKIFVDQYEIKEENSRHYLIINHIKSSKEWLTSLLEEYVNNENFEVPSEYVKILKAVI
ncbi:MAG: hypothetical protein DSZ07_05765 [Sulfurovum sp.]|nr:MAG: hypothetical protein DSZ07_05765 [Sulfurovum sp.]